jgi:Zn-finger nucleic acid-binding protein
MGSVATGRERKRIKEFSVRRTRVYTVADTVAMIEIDICAKSLKDVWGFLGELKNLSNNVGYEKQIEYPAAKNQ